MRPAPPADISTLISAGNTSSNSSWNCQTLAFSWLHDTVKSVGFWTTKTLRASTSLITFRWLVPLVTEILILSQHIHSLTLCNINFILFSFLESSRSFRSCYRAFFSSSTMVIFLSIFLSHNSYNPKWKNRESISLVLRIKCLVLKKARETARAREGISSRIEKVKAKNTHTNFWRLLKSYKHIAFIYQVLYLTSVGMAPWKFIQVL